MKNKTEKTITPYDDVHRTMLNDCPGLIIPVVNGVLDSYTKSMIVDMSKKVLEHLAMKYSNVRKEVGDIMGGKILDYPTKTFWRQAQREKLIELVQKKLAKNCSVEQIADALEESIETIQEIVDDLKKC